MRICWRWWLSSNARSPSCAPRSTSAQAEAPGAPFSKGSRVANPKPPGRKPGSGPFHYRAAPPREAITRPPVDVKVTLDGCPACGGPLEEERVDFAYQTEIPERPRPQVTQYRV